MGNTIYKKKQITELLDSDENIIGQKTEPETGPNLETKANRTTDYNAKVHGQNFKNDFLGRFGFYFYEGQEHNAPIVERQLTEEIGFENAKKAMDVIKPHIKEFFDKLEDDESINEGNVVEDMVVNKENDDRGDKIKSEKDKKEIKNKDVNKLAGVLKKLPKNELNKLIDLLEDK